METKEKTSNEFKCCVSGMDKQKMAEMIAKCSEDASGAGSWCSMMSKCMKGCRWFPVLSVILGIVLLLLGYYLDAEITRILWMMASGFVILICAFGVLMMGKMKKMYCG